ncbi:PASTA domain-containing protein [Arthrobacter sp. YN]|uniref:PASTA domain-containing protein n=1 Tax=Arthrobacter sp. YN TaxID=2020486 RepID=UPI0018DF221C|nr:PASTA domain-containing protein [Arthrobacter sp. YN]
MESAPTPTPSASSSPTAKPVQDVVGKTYLAARTALNNDDYFSRVVGKDGKEWTTNIVPDDSVLAVSMKPAAGETPDTDTIYITVNMTEAEFKAASAAKAETAKVAAEQARLATRYTYTCGWSSSNQPTYKSYKEIWASGDYKNGADCHVQMDGRSSYDKPPLLPSEQKLVDLVASKGGDVSVPSSTVGNVMLLCAKVHPDYADQVSAVPERRKAEAAAALTVCPDAPHAAILQAEIMAVKVSDGAKIVGQTMEPGIWKTKPGAKDCYWSRTTGGGDIIDNNFVGFAPDGVTVTVYAGEGFESSRCGTWTKIG